VYAVLFTPFYGVLCSQDNHLETYYAPCDYEQLFRSYVRHHSMRLVVVHGCSPSHGTQTDLSPCSELVSIGSRVFGKIEGPAQANIAERMAYIYTQSKRAVQSLIGKCAKGVLA
jgi:hypothetical protein